MENKLVEPKSVWNQVSHNASEYGTTLLNGIMENTDHIGELDFSGNVNVITFTKDQTDGRYGYLDGVVDVAERPGVGRR